MPATVFVGNQARIRGVVPRLLDATTPDGSIYSADKSSPRGTTSISTPDAQIGLRARNWRQKGSIVTMLSTARVERPTAGSGTSANRWRGTNDSFPPTAADFPHDKGWTAVDPGCAKIRAFNSLVESSSRFGQSETPKCWRRLSDEGNRENCSRLSWLAHVFTRPGP